MSKTTAADVYNAIRREIITGKIASDELILEQAVAQRFSVNRLTAREALQKLCTEKYLQSFPRKGYLVTDITAEQLVKIQQVRFQIEQLSIRLVIENCSDEQIERLREILRDGGSLDCPEQTVTNLFHLQIARLSGNEYIYDALRPYFDYMTRYAMTAIHANRFSNYVSYHEELVEAMLRRDYNEAVEFLRKDLMLDDLQIGANRP